MAEDFTIRYKRYDAVDPRLGRHVRHDSRSLSYLYPETADPKTLTSVRHERHIPTLDQGDLGSCTGNAATGNLGTAAFWDQGEQVLSATDADADETYAVGVYSDATKIDPYSGTYPPTDTGSDGLSVAKVLKNRGIISGYQHATSLNAALNALASQPVIIGVEWRNDMFDPDKDGRIHITGAVAGGHEIVLDELDVENERVWIHNSWGDSWGVDGRAYLTWDDFGTLLKADGDVTIFTPITEPAPVPTPPTPDPTPTPDPVDPTPTPVDPTLWSKIVEALQAFIDALKKILDL